MKTHPTTNGGLVWMILTGMFLVTGLTYADGVKSGPVTTKPNEMKDGRKTKVLVTGSHIPQQTARAGCTQTTISPVVIIDRSEIERSGQSTVAGVLGRQPAVR